MTHDHHQMMIIIQSKIGKQYTLNQEEAKKDHSLLAFLLLILIRCLTTINRIKERENIINTQSKEITNY